MDLGVRAAGALVGRDAAAIVRHVAARRGFAPPRRRRRPSTRPGTSAPVTGVTGPPGPPGTRRPWCPWCP